MFQLGINEYRGQRSLQLIVQDVRVSETLEKKYRVEKKRYLEIAGGERFSPDEAVMPTRADIAAVYKFLRYEGMCGRTAYSYRVLRCSILEHSGIDFDTTKLRFIIKILGEMKVCEFENLSEDIFQFEVCKDAKKSNIELTPTYKMLENQLRA